MSLRTRQPAQKAGCFDAAACYESGKPRPARPSAERVIKIIAVAKTVCTEDNDMAHFGPTRRSLLQGTLAASALGLTGFPARAEPQWKKYAGTKLEVILAKGPRGDNLQKNIKEFTDLTGIQVESEQIPEQQQRQKAVIELTSGKPSFDVIHVSYHVQKRQFEKAGWLADLSGYLKDPNLTAPDLVESDFSAAGLQYAKNDKGQMLSLPWSVDYFVLYYNKELLQKKRSPIRRKVLLASSGAGCATPI
jgi:ABC-type glycerol-3-phosphate transport system substrate-binding protein